MSIGRPDQYSEDGFWRTVKKAAKSVGKKVLQPGFELYYAMEHSQTPMWAKSVAVGALGYLIFPIDIVPDIIPVIGFGDDMVTMMAAVTSVGRYVTNDIRKKAAASADRLMNG